MKYEHKEILKAVGLGLVIIFGVFVISTLEVKAKDLPIPSKPQIISISTLNPPKTDMMTQVPLSVEETLPEPPVIKPKVTRYIIKDDPGGSVQEYIQSLMYAKNKGMKFKIDGMCASACTLVTANQLGLDLCVTENAILGIHHPFGVSISITGMSISYTLPMIAQADEMWDNLFLMAYPQWMVQKINDSGGAPNVYTGAEPSDLLRLDYKTINNNIKTCKENE